MTPEEKEEYMKQKKLERKQKLNETLKNRRIEQNQVREHIKKPQNRTELGKGTHQKAAESNRTR